MFYFYLFLYSVVKEEVPDNEQERVNEEADTVSGLGYGMINYVMENTYHIKLCVCRRPVITRRVKMLMERRKILK